MSTLKKISQLVRFCYASNIDFIDISDNDFTRFIHHLGTEVDPKNLREKKKATLTVVDVGTVCIDFLKYIGGLYEQPNFVAIGGRIKITESVTVKKDKRGRDYAVHSVWHHAFPPVVGGTSGMRFLLFMSTSSGALSMKWGAHGSSRFGGMHSSQHWKTLGLGFQRWRVLRS